MADDPMRQCGAVRREGTDVLRCGRPAVHVEQGTDHGDWRKIGEVDPTGGPWVGRVLDALWERVAGGAPDAWRPPDDAGRSVRPETPGAIPPGVEVIPLGSRGEGMSGDVGAVLGGILDAVTMITEAQAAARRAIEQGDQANGRVLGLAGQATDVHAIHATAARLNAANAQIEEAIQMHAAAIEGLNTWGYYIQAGGTL